ncbi:hypothetical protein PLICRDRAFT_34790 [Plicaturopsis crispa FD-325 SS-3]|nr:hypothetical protein PLICRDRAFT_34790 [Plicaturopsis crispa FD-325 SS-3]
MPVAPGVSFPSFPSLSRASSRSSFDSLEKPAGPQTFNLNNSLNGLIRSTPAPTSAFQKFVQRLEVPIDDNVAYQNDAYCNRDLIPIPPERRTWTWVSFAMYWVTSGISLSAYSVGSSLLMLGLSVQHAIILAVVGGFMSSTLAVAVGQIGEAHRISFGVATRYSWGMKLFYAPLVLSILPSIVGFGTQAYMGGQAVRVTLGALFPAFAHMKNTIPLSSNIATNDLIGILIWFMVYIPFVLIPPEKYTRPFMVTGAMFAVTLIGMLIWSVQHAGSIGPLFHQPPTTPQLGWAVMFGMNSVSGLVTGATAQMNWTRYSARPGAQMVSQLVAAPVVITFASVIGIVVTSACSQILGQLYWSPVQLLGVLQEHFNSSPHARAGVFFAGLGCFASTVSLNTLNSITTGMDIAALCPRFINNRRGAYLLAAAGIASCPWQILATAKSFLGALGGAGVFLAPITAIMISDYMGTRQKTISVPDLYIDGPESIYWYKNGCNWRAPLAWVIGTLPAFPGFVMSVMDPAASNFWIKLYSLEGFVGPLSTVMAVTVIAKLSPPPYIGLGTRALDDAVMFSNDRSLGAKYGLGENYTGEEGAGKTASWSEESLAKYKGGYV